MSTDETEDDPPVFHVNVVHVNVVHVNVNLSLNLPNTSADASPSGAASSAGTGLKIKRPNQLEWWGWTHFATRICRSSSSRY